MCEHTAPTNSSSNASDLHKKDREQTHEVVHEEQLQLHLETRPGID